MLLDTSEYVYPSHQEGKLHLDMSQNLLKFDEENKMEYDFDF